MEPSRTSAKGCYPTPGANAFSTPVEVPAAARARWLAEVAETLDRAELLLDRLKLSGRYADLVLEVELRIAIAKREVESLRTSRLPRDSSPRRTNLPPWEEIAGRRL